MGLLYEATPSVPSCPLHEQSVDICPLPRGSAEVFPVLLCHVALQAHLVKRPLVLAGHGLHDGREKGLGVEKPAQPDAGRYVEVRHPAFEFAETQQEIYKPRGETSEGRVSPLCPGVRDSVQEEGILEVLHILCDS